MQITFAHNEGQAPAPSRIQPETITAQPAASLTSRKLPWGTGTYVGGFGKVTKHDTSREALMDAGLDWEVGLGTIEALNHHTNEHTIAALRHRAVQRLDTGKVLGIVSPTYGVVQNRRLAEFNDTLVASSQGEVAVMGSAFDDRKVYAVTQLGDIDTPDGGLGSFLITVNSHDGGSSMFTTVANVRWACTNGLIGLSSKAHTIRVRHSAKVEERMHEAQRIMAGVSDYLADTTTLMEELLATPISKEEGSAIVRHTLIPLPDTESKTAIANAERKQEELISNWMHSENLNDVRNTGWGFVNAVAEWNEWTGSHVRRRRLTSMERLINDSGNEIVVQAKEMVLA